MKLFVATSSFGKDDAFAFDLLRDSGLVVARNTLGRTLGREDMLTLLDGCVGVIAGLEHYTDEVIGQLSDLKVISRCGAGLDGAGIDAARVRGMVVVSTPYGPTQAVVELTLGLMLSLIRNIDASSREIKRGEWKKKMGRLLGELTVGIVGLGRSGRRLAELLRSFGTTVVGCDVVPDLEWAAVHDVELTAASC